MKTHAFKIYKTGAPSVMKWEEVELGKPERGEVLLRHTAIGFNMVETYFRSGLYPLPSLPSGIGGEGAGVIEAVGRGVKGLKAGDRVCYAGGPMGSYAEARLIPAAGLIKLPSHVDEQTAAASLLKGTTVQFLFNEVHKLKKGETIVFHAAAGGVGLIACQWAKAVGATVIGTVSTPEKALIAKRHGCKHPIVVKKNQDLTDAVMRITKGAGVDVVYDSIGKDLWRSSMDSVRRRGLVVNFGSASGTPPLFDLALEGNKKSAYFTRAAGNNYMTSPDVRNAAARHLFRMMKSGAIKVHAGQTYPLREAAKAHRDAAARKTTGSTLLIP
ncbi:MAG: quinone oxidoreductase [Rhodospirillaceae bacterium]|nr:quinone oxidoreductase [Rhodospirillaceae bacterium]MBT5841158.1 quinone oxidoreductase [Rhodospirillaceae bacterium]MBT6289490.1 quinone oxidoreductase [Rhodospirillaceae bacterium]MBT7235207.1 quinone oxidoreductase [Rhodospirillaceae bacterium]MBT7570216.1 quinone oxidoreductase [Rhodospirillaceae bacterium]